MANLEGEFGNLAVSSVEEATSPGAAAPPPPPPPPMPSSLSSSSLSSVANGSAPPPPPPPGPGAGLIPTYKQQKEQNFQEQQMANLPSGLMTTAMKADKKPFSYTPVGLSAADLKSPSMIRQEKLEAAATGDSPACAIIPGIPRGPTHYRVFNGMAAPSPTFGGSASSEATGSSSYSPSLRRSNSVANSVNSVDEPEVRARPSANTATGTPIQSRSFRILQWMTGADQEDDVATVQPVSQVEPDEMRFRGYNQPAAIPSRAFQSLERMTAGSPQPQNTMHGRPASPSPYGGRPQQTQSPEPEPFRTDLTEEQAANLRYAGSGIPSRSFKMLQNMTDNEMVVPSSPGGHARQSPALSYHQGNGSPSGSLLQNLYGGPPTEFIAPPSPLDFKYQGPQYSTYQLPNPRSPAANSTATPKYSSSVNFTSTNNGGDFGRGQPQYASQASAYPPSHTTGSPYARQNLPQSQPPSYYGNVPSRNFQYSQVSTGQKGGHGISDF